METFEIFKDGINPSQIRVYSSQSVTNRDKNTGQKPAYFS